MVTSSAISSGSATHHTEVSDNPVTQHVASETPLTKAQQAAKARVQIASDLRIWQEKFATAADKGSDDLEERVSDIVKNLVDERLKQGESLVSTLQSTIAVELKSLKEKIYTIVRSLPEDATDKDRGDAQDRLLKDVRASGLTIRETAHAVRRWSHDFETELSQQVSYAADTTLDVLDNIRSLGLQEIGMRWAWMDGVTYKDWSKYHALKRQFSSWRDEVRNVGTRHSRVVEARKTVGSLLGKGMEIAESAAKELLNSKEIGKWKIEAEDASDSFEMGSADPRIVRANKKSELEPGRTEEPKSRTSPGGTLPQPQTKLTPEVSSPSKAQIEDSQEIDSDGTGSIVIGHDSREKDFPVNHGDPVAQPEAEAAWSQYTSGSGKPSVDAVPEGETHNEHANVFPGAFADVIRQKDEGPIYESEKIYSQSRVESTLEPSTSTLTLFDGVSQPSTRLQEDLDHAYAEYTSVIADASKTAEPEYQNIVLDARRRYYEALGVAHERYSESLQSETSAEPTKSPNPDQPATSASRSSLDQSIADISTATSLAAASLDAVLYSVSSARSTMDPESVRSIVSDASSRYESVLSVATSSLQIASSSIKDNPQNSHFSGKIAPRSPNTRNSINSPSSTTTGIQPNASNTSIDAVSGKNEL